jgi:hypothetical protein
MAISFDTATGEAATGGQLRQQLEQALNENKKLSKELRTERVQRVLGTGKFALISEQDLSDVELDEVEKRAAQLQEDRSKQKDELLRTALKDRGLDDEAIEAFIADGKASTEESDAAEAIGRIRTTGRNLDGTPVSKAVPDLEGVAAMRHHFEQQQKQAYPRR